MPRDCERHFSGSPFLRLTSKPGGLLVAIGDSAFGQVVWGKFHCHAISGENADSVAAELAGKVGENGAVGIQLNTKQATWELLNYSPSHFNAIFFTHRPLNMWMCAKRTIRKLYYTPTSRKCVSESSRSRSAADSGVMSRWGVPSISYPTMNLRTVAERSRGG
jgi:hypothetical protein